MCPRRLGSWFLWVASETVTAVPDSRVASSLVCSPCLCVLRGSRFLARRLRRRQTPDHSPVVTKVEPPSWWVGLTPEVMLLISGRGLEATKVECNLASLLVERTQASGGRQIFICVAEIWGGDEIGDGGLPDYESGRSDIVRIADCCADGDDSPISGACAGRCDLSDHAGPVREWGSDE